MSTSAPAAARVLLRFDSFELDLRAGELRKRGLKLRLQGQPLQLLAILLQDAGNLVTREELRDQIWPADTFVDFDHSLNNAVARIREVLGDSAEAPRYIETLPRRGYRFIAPVEEVLVPRVLNGVTKSETAAADSAAGALVEALPGSRVSTNGARGGGGALAVAATAATGRAKRRWLLGVLIVCVCGVIGSVTWLTWRHFSARDKVSPLHSLAVLPLQNLSGDADQEYFADGMTDEMITEFSRIRSLKVISRTSVMTYKGTKKRLPQIARELGADAIVEGSVTREGDQVRITVQLLDAANDRHLWSEDYQRPLHGVLNLQREVAESIAEQIFVQLNPQQGGGAGSARTVDPEAYEDYLRARYYLSTQFSMPQPLNMARGYFEEAIRKDPNFALAYAGLADTYFYQTRFHHLSPESGYRSADAALQKAMELDASIGEGHTVLAMLRWREGDWATARRELESAVTLNPGDGCARAMRAIFYAWSGQRVEALAGTTQSRTADASSSYASTEAAIYFLLRDYAKLVEASQRGVVSDPHEWLEHYYLGLGYEGSGKLDEAMPEYEKAVTMSEGDQEAMAALAHAYAAVGRRAEATKILRDMEARSKVSYVSPYTLATMFAGLGENDRALNLLEKAYQEKSWDLMWYLKADPRMDSLRSEPRFIALVQRMGFPQ
jgi:TolB-like protein/DNA-binding winged helix-turn-helix (wHTH) protein/Tfp pilus assembly protein PilF